MCKSSLSLNITENLAGSNSNVHHNFSKMSELLFLVVVSGIVALVSALSETKAMVVENLDQVAIKTKHRLCRWA